MAVYITGDTHGQLDSFHTEFIDKNIQKGDKLIVCGDFGFIWHDDICPAGKKADALMLDFLAKKDYEILFCDGNHENFNELLQYPVTEIYSGKAHKIRDNIYHLMRGEVFEIEGNSFFVMGGAYSIDKGIRSENISWWKQELPVDDEYKNAISHIKEYHYKIDFIISHTCPGEIIKVMMNHYPDVHDAELTGFLDYILYEVDFRHWYFGHWHTDKDESYSIAGKEKKFSSLFNDIKKIEP